MTNPDTPCRASERPSPALDAERPSPAPFLPERGEDERVPLRGREGLGEGRSATTESTPARKTRRFNPETLTRARENRAQLTPAETRLWSALRAGQLAGLKFTKQAIFEPYIADFACRTARLIVEIDGDSHAFQQDYDERRTAFLAAKGYRVLRFTNADVFGALDWVLHEIAQAAKPSPDPSLPGRGENSTFPSLEGRG